MLGGPASTPAGVSRAEALRTSMVGTHTLIITDLFSAFYLMTVASPAIAALQLEDHRLRWSHAPAVVGHARSATDES